jgi:hypothetical protein
MVRGLLAESPKVTLASGAGIAGVSGVSTFPEISEVCWSGVGRFWGCHKLLLSRINLDWLIFFRVSLLRGFTRILIYAMGLNRTDNAIAQE